jgi:phytoene synthase
VDDIVEQSRQAIERGSRSFAAAARLFDPDTRASAYMLYAWCRHCDDLTDGQELGWGATELPADAAEAHIESLRDTTRRALAGEAVDDPLFVGLAHVVAKHEIPHRYPLEHLEGFAMDVDGHEYLELEDTLRYCYHVAGVVGVMMAYIMGARDEDALHRATDLGLAFQLTNIARDVMDDAAVGRVYLPARRLEAVGVPVDEISERRHRGAVFEVTRGLLDEADRYYASAVVGLSSLPFRSAWAVATAKEVYQDIGRIVREPGARASRCAACGRRCARAARRRRHPATVSGPARRTPRDSMPSWRRASHARWCRPGSRIGCCSPLRISIGLGESSPECHFEERTK